MITITLLVFTTLLGGIAAHRLNYRGRSIKLPLIFAGAFLFSITIIHILPEIFTSSSKPMWIGIFVLGGFFLQQILEQFTSGVEHGHFHSHPTSGAARFNLLFGLMLHSLMEGALLTHDSPFHSQGESYSLLFGIILHKAPAAFALMAVFKEGTGFTRQQWLILLLFSIASPTGYLLSNMIMLSHESLMILFAVVSGAFLHISTTIFVETSPDHHFGWNKLFVSILGALLAILAEYFL